MKKLKTNDGFTLIEVIFSVAFLCIVSVIVLRLFVASYEIENRTEKVDLATIQMFNEIEEIKRLDFIEENTIIEVYYDEFWSEVEELESNYKLLIKVKKSNLSESGLFDIEALVFDLKSEEEISSIETMHYYNQKE